MTIKELERISTLLENLGNPQDQLCFVHVVGTNGKGSTCAFLASILAHAGYKTGLFTSPFVVKINERICVNGRSIDDHELMSKREAVKRAANDLSTYPTEFELMTAVAFSYFAQEKCEIVICEAGLGGRKDATNVLRYPEASVITSIGIDHQDMLGDTLEKIAYEKAGIIMHGSPVVSWPHGLVIREVFKQATHAVSTSISYPDFAQIKIKEFDLRKQSLKGVFRSFSYKEYRDLRIKLIAEYQVYNAVLAIETIEVLRKRNWEISNYALRKGLAATLWPGRFEIVAEHPLVIVDSAHNAQAVQALRSSLASVLSSVKPVFIIGILEDKGYSNMFAEIVTVGETFVIVEPPSPRALAAKKLADALRTAWQNASLKDTSLVLEIAGSFEEALKIAINLAGEEGAVCSFGSIYSVAPLKQALSRINSRTSNE